VRDDRDNRALLDRGDLPDHVRAMIERNLKYKAADQGLPENAPASLKNVRACPVAKPSSGPKTKFIRRPYQRSPDRERSKRRRQRLAASSPMPPSMAERLTPCQQAYARFVADEVMRSGDCRRSLDEIAARVGMAGKTAQRAQQRLKQLGWIEVEHRPIDGQRHETNIVCIVSPEWLTWIAMGKIPKHIGGQKCLSTANTLFGRAANDVFESVIQQLQERRPAIDKPVDVDPALIAVLDRFRKAVKKE
jgi:hypothetical protein